MADSGCGGSKPSGGGGGASGTARRNAKIDRGLGGMRRFAALRALMFLMAASHRPRHANPPAKSSCT